MTDKVFLQVLNMSLTSSFVIIFVIIARLFLKKAPKIFSYSLWIIVLIRLLCPFSFESILSLVPTKPDPIPNNIMYMKVPEIDTGIVSFNNTINPILPKPVEVASANPLQIWIFIGNIIWITGILLIILYSIYSLFKLRKRLKNAVYEKENIYVCKNIDTAFVLGLFSPKIYIPDNLTEDEKRYIIYHEKTHIKRFDHVIKIIAFIALTIHFFNPLVWVSFFFLSKDMEMACDESVLKIMGNDIKKDYSRSLLSLSTGKRILNGTPLAFGEGNTKSRIKNVLNYKKPPFWGLVLAFVIVVLLIFGLISNPKTDNENFLGSTYRVSEIIYNSPINSHYYSSSNEAPKYCISSDFLLYKAEAEGSNWWDVCGELSEYNIEKDKLLSYFTPVLDDNNIEKLINKTNKIFRCDNKEDSSFYLLFIQKNGDVLLSEGSVLNNNEKMPEIIKWLFKLDKFMDEDFIEDIYSFRTKYIGDASKVGNIIQRLYIPSEYESKGMELFTTTPPYGLRINYSQNKDIKTKITNNLFDRNSIILFSLIENLGYIEFAVNDTVFLSRDRAWVESLTGSNLFEKSETINEFRSLVKSLSNVSNLSEQEALSNTEKPISLFTFIDNLPVGCDFVRKNETYSENMFEDTLKTQGFTFDISLEKNPQVHLYFTDETPKNVYIKHSLNNNEFKEFKEFNISKDYVYVINIPKDDGTHYFLSEITWEDLKKETLLFKANILNSEKQVNLPNYSYEGKDEILKLVYDTIGFRESLKSSTVPNSFLVPSVTKHGEYYEENKLKVFATVFSKTFSLYDDQLKSVGGSIIPIAITYEKDDKGNYKMIDYVETKDGSYFSTSIKDFCKYPVSGKTIDGLFEKIIDDYTSNEERNIIQRKNLVSHLKKYNISKVYIVNAYNKKTEELNIK